MICTYTGCERPARFVVRGPTVAGLPHLQPNGRVYLGRSCRRHLPDWVDDATTPVWVEKFTAPPVVAPVGQRVTKRLRRTLRRRAMRRGGMPA